MDGKQLIAWWHRLNRLPGGRSLFSLLLGRAVPYSGSVGAKVISLAPGAVTIEMKECRKIRNHLRSVHAIALANVNELASGLALMTTLPNEYRGIVREYHIEYLKKARGKLTASSVVALPELDGDTDFTVTAQIHDEAGECVASSRVLWRLGLKR